MELGVALAQIHNKETFAVCDQIIHMGVGSEEDDIIEWVEDIWETYDKNDDGNVDKREIRKFLD